MQRRQFDRNAGTVLDAATVRGAADGVYRRFVGNVIIGCVFFRQRRFAQHVVGITITTLFIVAAIFQRLGDGLAGDELVAQHPHRQIDALADQRLTAFGDQLGESRTEALLAAGANQLAGHQQTPGGGIDEQRRRFAQMATPVAFADLVCDQAVGGLAVGNPQQRFGQAHQRHALFRR